MLIFHKQSEPHEVINLACLYPLDTFIKVPLSAMVSNSQMNSVPQFIITLWSCSTLWKSYVLYNILHTTRWLQWILRLPFRGDEKMFILYSLKEYANYSRYCMITNKILHMFHIASVKIHYCKTIFNYKKDWDRLVCCHQRNYK